MVRPHYFIPALTLALVAGSTQAVQACATCFGKSDEAMARGMNMGILTLLICIVGVLFGMTGAGFYLIRRAARLASVQSPDASVADAPGVYDAPVAQTTKQLNSWKIS